MIDNSSFTSADIELIESSEFIYSKNKVFSQIAETLASLGNNSLTITSNKLLRSPKISKGENLNDLPYLVLDFPREFKKENILAFRCLFWWGKYISCTLHLKGTYLALYQSKLANLTADINSDYYYSYQGDEWSHNVFSENYNNSNVKKIEWANKYNFLKISFILPIHKINDLTVFYTSIYSKLVLPLLNDKH